VKVGDLIANPRNPRTITDAQLAALKQSLEVFGDLGGVVKNKKTGRLVGGHMRVRTLDASWPIRIEERLTPDKCGTVARGFIDTPYGEISYREVDWTEEVEAAAMVAANQHGGEWSDAALKEILIGLDDGSGLIELSGFDTTDLSGLLDRQPPAPTPSEKEVLFEQISFVVTKEQLSAIGYALDKAGKAGDFGDTGNQNARGNALARICESYGR